MIDFTSLYQAVYKKGQLFGIDKPLKQNPLLNKQRRANSIAVVGGALGDEGKGKVTDELTAHFLTRHKKVIHYRDNGGANAGHTVEVGKVRIALHQLGSGIMQKGCVVVLGKEMVLHPDDLLLEIQDVKKAVSKLADNQLASSKQAGSKKKQLPAQLRIDELAYLCLDTHRAFEAMLKERSTGSKGATGRGIAPAYADVIYRHPLRMRDLLARDWQEKFTRHYQYYQDLAKGLGYVLNKMSVPRLSGGNLPVGSLKVFLERLTMARRQLKPYIGDVHAFLSQHWSGITPMVFEKAQALGLDSRWGVYPDVTASNCGFDGILSATEGIVDPTKLAIRAATIKATYSSSVGQRRLPTEIKTKLADRIREDAFEYGATTKRPRDIAYLDLPMLSFLARVGGVEYLTMTHLDISYLDTPIKVCVAYRRHGKLVDYRPDQQYLNSVKPVYVELPSWDGAKLATARKIADLPKEALQYLAFITQALGVQLLVVTTGPKREQSIRWY